MNAHLADPAASGDWLDAALRDDGVVHRAGYIDDGGFTARVMSALPPPATLPAWRRPVLVALWGLAAVGIALALPGAMMDVAREVLRALGGQPVSLLGISTGVIALAAATWAAAAYALHRD